MPKPREQRERERAERRERIARKPKAPKPEHGHPPHIPPDQMPSREDILKAWKRSSIRSAAASGWVGRTSQSPLDDHLPRPAAPTSEREAIDD